MPPPPASTHPDSFPIERRTSSWLAPDRLAYAAIAAYALYSAYLGKLLAPAIEPDRFRDFGILMEFARAVAATGRYPLSGVYYPPSCMIVFDLLRRLGPETMFRLHLVAQGAALCFTVVAWQRRLPAATALARGLAALLAVAGASFYVHTELRMHNVNMVSLALVTAAVLSWPRSGRWGAAASALMLGGSLAIKPYGAALLMPWMAWHGAWRWLAATVAALLLFFVLLPVLWFGSATTLTLYADWLSQLGTLETPAVLRANELSLRAAVARLTNTDVMAPGVAMMTQALSAAWLLLVAGYMTLAARPRGMPSGERLAAQVGALLMTPLALGPLQQPGRGVALLVAMIALATGVCDPARAGGARAAMAAIVAVVALAPWLVPMGALHAGLTIAVCALTLLGLTIHHLSAPQRPPPERAGPF
jgi:hypothetical protein